MDKSYYVVKNNSMDQYERVVAFSSIVGGPNMSIQVRAQIESFIMGELAWVLEKNL